jgi:hypothetical protein
MGESVDDSRSADDGRVDAGDESALAQAAEAEQPVSEPEPSRDDYVPV